jgi:hypothetical protein
MRIELAAQRVADRLKELCGIGGDYLVEQVGDRLAGRSAATQAGAVDYPGLHPT